MDEILNALDIVDLPYKTRALLDSQHLATHPNLECTIVGGVRKYTFKPSLHLRNKRELVAFVKEHQNKGLGGVPLDSVQESMTNEEFDKFLKVSVCVCVKDFLLATSRKDFI